MNEQTKQDSPVLYTEDTQTPTNVNTTMQAPITKEDGVILDDYAAKDQAGKIDNTTYATTPNTTTSSKTSATGSGLNAAEGTTYSWEKKASDRANLDYQSAVLESKSNYLTNRQELETQGQQMQDQVAMQKYSQNQSSEKAGWTGGYILDTERQMAYLKQTIQSQMYGSMELQKYGYDTSLAAARLAYDTNKYDLALEYYNTALSRAVSEAEITGYYVSPETSEMLNEYSIASQTLNDPNAREEDKQRADKVLASVYEWFEANGISKQGVETYSHIVEERTNKLSIESTYEYIDKANKQIDTDTFTKVDANGNVIFNEDNTKAETINFSSISSDELLQYVSSSETAKQQYYGYLDTKITQEAEVQFKDWLISKGLMDKDEQGNYTPKEGTNYEKHLYSYLKSSQLYEDLTSDILNAKDTEYKELYDLYSNWDFEITLPNGSTIVTTFSDLDTKMADSSNLDVTTQLDKNAAGEYINTFTPDSSYDNTLKIHGEYSSGHVVTVGNNGQQVFIWQDIMMWDDGKPNGGGDMDTESDLFVWKALDDDYKEVDGERNGGWDLEIASTQNPFNDKTNELLKKAFKDSTGKDISNGNVIMYEDKLYVYAHDGFRSVKGQCGRGSADTIVKELKSQTGID